MSRGISGGKQVITYANTSNRRRVCLLVSLRNRTAGRRGRQNVCVWQTWQGYYLHVMSWSSLSVNVFFFLQKDLFKRTWCLAKSYFKQNCCHGCHTRFAVFFPLPSCCVSSLLGSVSNKDGDRYENVTQKVGSRCFNLNRAYSVSFISSNVGGFFGSWILKNC